MSGEKSPFIKAAWGRRILTFGLISAWLSAPPVFGGDEKPVPPAAPDILLVMVDSLRADSLGCYGQALPTSPVIDGFAASAVRFDQAFASAPWTQPSVMSVFTSLSPDRHGLVLPTAPYATNVTTLAECLQKAGYQTVGVTANPMAHCRYGFARGFDHYDDYTIVMEPGGDLMKTAAQAAGQVATGATITRLAENWLRRRNPDKPLFLFLFYMDPHWDYLPPPPYGSMFTDDPTPPLRNVYSLGDRIVSRQAKERVRAAYAGEIRYTDDCLGRLFNAVSNSSRATSTAIVVCGDHGEAFWERNMAGHGNNLFDEELRVPLIIKARGAPEGGTIVPGQVGLIDLAPTLADLAGVKAPADWQGVSLKGCLAKEAAPLRPLVLDNRIKDGVARGVRTAEYKMIARPPFQAPSEVYDLKADPGETNNLAAGSNPLPPAVAALIPMLKPTDTFVLTSKGTSP